MALVTRNYVYGTESNDNIVGTTSDDYIQGYAGNDTLVGNEGNDTLDGGAGVDSMSGGAGDDSYWISLNNDIFTDVVLEQVSQGIDSIFIYGSELSLTKKTPSEMPVIFLPANVENGYIWGKVTTSIVNAVFLNGNSLNNYLYSQDYPAWFDGGLGDDTIEGASFNKNTQWSNWYSAGGSPVNVNLQTGYASGDSIGNDKLINIFSVWASIYDDVVTGSNDYPERILGDLGNDTLEGGLGKDDYLDYFNASGPVNINLLTGQVTGASGTDVVSGFEMANGSAYDDTIKGNNQGNNLFGNGGNDTIYAGTANDYITGGAGRNLINAGDGSDSIINDGGVDYINGEEGDDSITLNSVNVFRGAYYAENEFLKSAGILNGFNVLASVDGKSRYELTINGGSGLNYIGASTYDDAIFLDDVISKYQSDSLSNSARLISIQKISLKSGNDLLDLTSTKYSIESVQVWGGDGNDIVWGGPSSDEIIGGNGNDTIQGGPGDDILTGSADADVFIYASGSGHDQITDFQLGEDKIILINPITTTATVTNISSNTQISWNNIQIDLIGVTLPSTGVGWIEYSTS